MSQRTRGILFLILSAFFFACMNLAVRLAGDLPSVQKSFFRNLVAAVFALVILLRQHISFVPERKNLVPLLCRAVFGTLGVLANFYAVDHLVLSNASILNKMSPFFVLIFSWLFLKERLTAFQTAAFFMAFVGALFVVQPVLSNLALGPSLIGLCSGMGAGAAYTAVRALGLRGERSPVIVFFFSTFSCVVLLPWLFFRFQPMTLYQLLMLLGAGVAAAGGQFGITLAYTHAPGREVSIYDYSQILFAAGLGWILFAQLPDRWSVLGYVLIVGAALAIFLYNNGYPPFAKKETA